MKLNFSEWEEFIVGKVFDCNTTILSIKDVLEIGNIPFISRTAENNGCDGYVMVENDAITEGQCLTVGAEGIYCFYQPKDFATGNKVYTLRNNKLNFYQYIFIATILNKEDYKYSYGRARIKSKLENEVIKLPIHYNSDGSPLIDNTYKYSDEGYVPDWQFMEDYIKSLHHKPITTKVKTGNMPKLNLQSWQWFSMSKLFDIKKGKRLTSADQEEGSNNYVGAIDSNNGIANHIGQAPIHKANTISLSYNGSVGEAFYQSEPYWATDDVNALYSKYDGFNKQIGLFMVTVIRQEKYKFSYGRKWTLDNMNKTEIKLPIQQDDKGNPIIDNNYTYSDKGYIPDWQFMEDYINSLPYSDRIK